MESKPILWIIIALVVIAVIALLWSSSARRRREAAYLAEAREMRERAEGQAPPTSNALPDAADAPVAGNPVMPMPGPTGMGIEGLGAVEAAQAQEQAQLRAEEQAAAEEQRLAEAKAREQRGAGGAQRQADDAEAHARAGASAVETGAVDAEQSEPSESSESATSEGAPAASKKSSTVAPTGLGATALTHDDDEPDLADAENPFAPPSWVNSRGVDDPSDDAPAAGDGEAAEASEADTDANSTTDTDDPDWVNSPVDESADVTESAQVDNESADWINGPDEASAAEAGTEGEIGTDGIGDADGSADAPAAPAASGTAGTAAAAPAFGSETADPTEPTEPTEPASSSGATAAASDGSAGPDEVMTTSQEDQLIYAETAEAKSDEAEGYPTDEVAHEFEPNGGAADQSQPDLPFDGGAHTPVAEQQADTAQDHGLVEKAQDKAHETYVETQDADEVMTTSQEDQLIYAETAEAKSDEVEGYPTDEVAHEFEPEGGAADQSQPDLPFPGAPHTPEYGDPGAESTGETETASAAGAADRAPAASDDTDTAAAASSSEHADGHPNRNAWGTEEVEGGRDASGRRRYSRFDEVVDGGYGVGSASPVFDGAQPMGHPVKGRRATQHFATPDESDYDSLEADVWFYDEDAARRAGFRNRSESDG